MNFDIDMKILIFFRLSFHHEWITFQLTEVVLNLSLGSDDISTILVDRTLLWNVFRLNACFNYARFLLKLICEPNQLPYGTSDVLHRMPSLSFFLIRWFIFTQFSPKWFPVSCSSCSMLHTLCCTVSGKNNGAIK